MSKSCVHIGVLGCGPIAQFAHFESCQKAKNVQLYAICDVAEDLLNKMNVIWNPVKTYTVYEDMLNDPNIDAVILAVSDSFHIPTALQAIQAGKHVLVEKPLGTNIDQCLELKEAVQSSGLYLQVGHNKRFDPGIEFAQQFIQEKLGTLIGFKSWYGDNNHRYTYTDNLQAIPVKSKFSKQTKNNEKTDLEKYYLRAHGSHLVDSALHLCGEIAQINARFRKVDNVHCWFCDVGFKNGTLGQLDLTIKIRGDWHEGFQLYGENGSIFCKSFNPWFYKASEVKAYYEPTKQYYSPLAADGFSYRRQIEHFADVILNKRSPKACGIDEGIASVKALIGIHYAVKTGQTIDLDNLPSEIW